MNENSAVPLRVAVVGLGTIGRAVAAAVCKEQGLTLVGGVDLSEAKLDRVRSETPGDLIWTDDVESIEAIDIAIITAGPHFDRIAPTVRQLIRTKAHMISDCAEMAWPWLRHPHLADVIAGEARKAGVAVLGTGAWPGLMSAALPLTLATTVSGLKRISVRRTVDVRAARPSVARRAGLSLSPNRLRMLAKERQVGFPGLGEAATLLAQALGRHPTSSEIVTFIGPATNDLGHPGVHQTATYHGNGIEIEVMVTLHAADEPAGETVIVEGDRVIQARLPAIPDVAAAAVMVNTARQLPTLPAGLLTTLDLLPRR